MPSHLLACPALLSKLLAGLGLGEHNHQRRGGGEGGTVTLALSLSKALGPAQVMAWVREHWMDSVVWHCSQLASVVSPALVWGHL